MATAPVDLRTAGVPPDGFGDPRPIPCNVDGVELRGLLKLVVTRIHCTRHLHNDMLVNVLIGLIVPDRDNFRSWVNIEFTHTYQAQWYHLDRGMSPEQSAIAQALQVLWEHELGEGYVCNGVCVWNPEPAHAPRGTKLTE